MNIQGVEEERDNRTHAIFPSSMVTHCGRHSTAHRIYLAQRSRYHLWVGSNGTQNANYHNQLNKETVKWSFLFSHSLFSDVSSLSMSSLSSWSFHTLSSRVIWCVCQLRVNWNIFQGNILSLDIREKLMTLTTIRTKERYVCCELIV